MTTRVAPTRAPIVLRSSRRFLKQFKQASGPLQGLAVQEAHLMQRRAIALPRWKSEYQHVKGIEGHDVLELELGRGSRLLVHVTGRIATLLSLGGHEIVRRYVRGNTLEGDLKRSVDAPTELTLGHKDPLLPRPRAVGPEKLTRWWPEVSPDWLYFLDEEQARVCDEIVAAVEDVLLSEGTYTLQLVVGGPGVGKTSILLQLLRRLSNQVVANSETWAIGLKVTDRMASYITVSTGWNLAKTRRLAEDVERTDVLLVDDPASEAVINDLAGQARYGHVRAVVIALDPLQLGDSISDDAYRKLVRRHKAAELTLHSCYRQKHEVGTAAVRIAKAVAASSPFLDDTKQRTYRSERQRLTRLANTVTFTNPSGFATTYPDATLGDWREHISWIRRQHVLHARWPDVLVVVDGETALPPGWRRELSKVHHEVVALSAMQELIKGLEYQHVLVVLSEDRLRALEQGFTGSGRRLYNDYRLLRIPFTRARDSLAVFGRPRR